MTRGGGAAAVFGVCFFFGVIGGDSRGGPIWSGCSAAFGFVQGCSGLFGGGDPGWMVVSGRGVGWCAGWWALFALSFFSGYGSTVGE